MTEQEVLAHRVAVAESMTLAHWKRLSDSWLEQRDILEKASKQLCCYTVKPPLEPQQCGQSDCIPCRARKIIGS